jgi:hypothetical protein
MKVIQQIKEGLIDVLGIYMWSSLINVLNQNCVPKKAGIHTDVLNSVKCCIMNIVKAFIPSSVEEKSQALNS